MKVKLGDKVKDTVTGHTGIAVGITEYLNGCLRVGVQSKVKKDGVVPDTYYFDEPQLVVVKKKQVKKGPADTGGPIPSKPTKHKAEKR